jgi:RNA polymerase alpha subunit
VSLLLVASFVCDRRLTSALPGWSIAAIVEKSGDDAQSSAPFTLQALAPRSMASLQARPRIRVVESLVQFRSTVERSDDRRVVPFVERLTGSLSSWARWAIAASTFGAVMMVVIDPDRPSATPVARVAALLTELGDVSSIQFTPTEANVLREIQHGERIAVHIARVLGFSQEHIRVVASRIAHALQQEKERRVRDTANLPFEVRPIVDLRLRWPTQRLLGDAGIETVGQLLERSEADLLRLRALGAGRLNEIKERLWLEGRRTLRGSEPPKGPTGSPDSDDGAAQLLLPFWLIGTDPKDLGIFDAPLTHGPLLILGLALCLVARHRRSAPENVDACLRAA